MTIRELRHRATQQISSLSPARLRVAVDFLEYLDQREDNAATRELLRIPGFKRAIAKAAKDVASGRSKDWRKVRTDV